MSLKNNREERPGFIEKRSGEVRKISAATFIAAVCGSIVFPVFAEAAVGAGIVFAGSEAAYTSAKKRRHTGD
jgi:hypothetical protein